MSAILRSAASIIAALALTAFAILAPAAAQEPAKITIVVFGFPSLGAFMPPVIKAQKLDTANGLDIEFVERPPDAYTTQSTRVNSRLAAAPPCSRSVSPTPVVSK